MAINWDPGKLKANVEKHGVHFADAVPVLEDPLAVTITDRESDPTEERFVVLGLDALARNTGSGLHVAGRRYPFDFGAARELARAQGVRRPMKNHYDFSHGKRGAVLPTTGKERITIRIDSDIVDYFRGEMERAGGGNYQTAMNAVLREFVDGKKSTPQLEDIVRRVIREELRAAS